MIKKKRLRYEDITLHCFTCKGYKQGPIIKQPHVVCHCDDKPIKAKKITLEPKRAWECTRCFTINSPHTIQCNCKQIALNNNFNNQFSPL